MSKHCGIAAPIGTRELMRHQFKLVSGREAGMTLTSMRREERSHHRHRFRSAEHEITLRPKRLKLHVIGGQF
jgi:hypothetical protein